MTAGRQPPPGRGDTTRRRAAATPAVDCRAMQPPPLQPTREFVVSSARRPQPAAVPALLVFLPRVFLTPVLLLLGLLLPALAAPACAGDGGEPPAAAADAGDVEAETAETAEAENEDEGPPLVGVVSREEVEAHEPGWVAAEIEAQPDAGAARALLDVEPGAEVTVYLGTWCSDSRRELARLWRAFDDTGIGLAVEPPFGLEYVAVDRAKEQPADRLAGVGLEYVPTFVVRRGGEEVGRVVEISPNGIEHDLLALLSGEASGVVSGRDDLGDGAAEPPADPGS